MWLSAVFLLLAFACFGTALARLYRVLPETQTPVHPFVTLVYVISTSINTAWLSVASCLGLLIVAKCQGIHDKALLLMSVGLISVVGVGGLAILITKRDVTYGLTLIWALVAICGGHKIAVVRYVSLAAIVALGLCSTLVLTKSHVGARFPQAEDAGLVMNQALLSEGRLYSAGSLGRQEQ